MDLGQQSVVPVLSWGLELNSKNWHGKEEYSRTRSGLEFGRTEIKSIVSGHGHL
jgi:hypothetical protein